MSRAAYVLALAILTLAVVLAWFTWAITQRTEPPAKGSELAQRGSGTVRLHADRRRAWVQVGTKRLLVLGAVNARSSSAYPRPQVAFRKLYGARSIPNHCGHYLGEPLPFLVRACTAGETHWAVQRWRRLGRLGKQGPLETHVSHWTGDPARIELFATWRYPPHYRRIIGRFTYRSQPVYGFKNTRVGKPLDKYGRNVYVDSLDSRYGHGWHRVEGFLTHRPTGAFCWLVPVKAVGTKYRFTILGPGVTPIVRAAIVDPGSYDPAHAETVKNAVAGWHDPVCK